MSGWVDGWMAGLTLQWKTNSPSNARMCTSDVLKNVLAVRIEGFCTQTDTYTHTDMDGCMCVCVTDRQALLRCAVPLLECMQYTVCSIRFVRTSEGRHACGWWCAALSLPHTASTHPPTQTWTLTWSYWMNLHRRRPLGTIDDTTNM